MTKKMTTPLDARAQEKVDNDDRAVAKSLKAVDQPMTSPGPAPQICPATQAKVEADQEDFPPLPEKGYAKKERGGVT